MSSTLAGEAGIGEGWLGPRSSRGVRYPYMVTQGSKRVKMFAVRPLKGFLQSSELAWHCFCSILLVKANHEANPSARGGETTPPLDGRRNMCRQMQRGEGLLGPDSAHPTAPVVLRECADIPDHTSII